MSASAPVVAPAPAQTNLFGQIITPGMVERAVAASLAQWMDTYLGQLERIETDETGALAYQPDGIERPRGILTRGEFDKWPEEQIPVIVVVCPGLAGLPRRQQQGAYHAAWSVGIAAIVSAGSPDGTGQDATRRLMGVYGAAIRAAILQHKMLRSPLYPDGFASESTWQDEQYTDVPELAARSLAAARIVFNIGVDNVVTEQAGPRAPLSPADEDPGSWPPVKSATANVNPIGLEDPLP